MAIAATAFPISRRRESWGAGGAIHSTAIHLAAIHAFSPQDSHRLSGASCSMLRRLTRGLQGSGITIDGFGFWLRLRGRLSYSKMHSPCTVSTRATHGEHRDISQLRNGLLHLLNDSAEHLESSTLMT
jgi:hypothetical protein